MITIQLMLSANTHELHGYLPRSTLHLVPPGRVSQGYAGVNFLHIHGIFHTVEE